MARTMNTRIGIILATVTILLMAVASRTPAAEGGEDPDGDARQRHRGTVSPSPSQVKMPPRVDAISTQWVTLPTQALAQ